MTPIMIDKEELRRRVEEKSRLILDELTLDNLNYFPLQAKDIAQGMLEDYAHSVFRHYTEGLDKIQDPEAYNRFVDYLTGYQHQMRQWEKEHPIDVELVCEMPQQPVAPVKPLSLWVPLGTGAAVAVALWIYAPVWAGFVAAAAAGLAALMMKYKADKREFMYRQELKMYELKIDEQRQKLVDGVIADLGKWLDMGVEASVAILSQYGLK